MHSPDLRLAREAVLDRDLSKQDIFLGGSAHRTDLTSPYPPERPFRWMPDFLSASSGYYLRNETHFRQSMIPADPGM